MEITEEMEEEFGEIAEQMADKCHYEKICPSPLYLACPFEHVKTMPQDCRFTTKKQWIILLDKLADLQGTI